MRTAIIHNLPDWTVESHGNGLAYEVKRLESGESLYFQGDDADAFRDQLTGLTEASGGPVLDYADALRIIWSDYA